MLDTVLGHGQLDETHRTVRVVVDVQVLHVDAALPGVGKQPGQLARMVGHCDVQRGVGAGGPAVLAGQPRGARDATVEQAVGARLENSGSRETFYLGPTESLTEGP